MPLSANSPAWNPNANNFNGMMKNVNNRRREWAGNNFNALSNEIHQTRATRKSRKARKSRKSRKSRK